jgi:hypothetical protein
LKRGTTFYRGTSSDSKWILNENSEKLLGLKFEESLLGFLLGIFKLEWNKVKRLVFAPSDQLNAWRRV